MSTLSIGDLAPDFELMNQDGLSFRLSDILGKQKIVLYFYPKDETPGCTKEACSFRDSYEDFIDAGAEVIGVSSDSVQSHKNFQTDRRLPFQLLSDPKSKIAKMYGVSGGLFGLIPGRETFVINKEGKIHHKFSSQFQIDKHINDALKVVKELA